MSDRFVCERNGCTRGRGTGHALYRTSPKGDLFRGACAEHHPDATAAGKVAVAQIIEDRNLDPARRAPGADQAGGA